MGIEYLGTLLPHLACSEVLELVAWVCDSTSCKVIREEAPEFGLCFGAPGATGREDFTLNILESKVYLVFHTGSGNQRETIIKSLERAAERHGRVLSLNEE